MHTDNTASRPLKILHVASHNVIRAGGSIQMMRLALGLQQRGHQVCCAFNLKKGDRPPGFGTFDPLQAAGIRVFSLPMQRVQKYLGMLKLRKLLAENRFDIVHTHRFRALQFVCTATRGLKTPVILGNKKNSFPIPPGWVRLYGSPKVSSIIVNAQFIKDMFIETGRVDPHKIEIIYNGVDLDQFHPGVDGSLVRKEFNIGKEVSLIGMVANFARKKSHGLFFEAALKVLQEKPDVKFLLAGGGDYPLYQKELAAKGCGDSFVFTGFRTDVPAIIAALDVALISSAKGEGLTGSLVEAMAMAKPVISTNVSGNPDFVKNRETGLLVPAGNAPAMADAMLYLLGNPDEALQLGRNAHDFVRDRVDNRLRTRQFEELYYRLINNRGIPQ